MEMRKLFLAGAALMIAAPAHAAEQNKTTLTQCVLYIDQIEDQLLHVRVPICFDPKGNVIMHSRDGEMRVTSRAKCEVDKIESVERVDPSTYLVHTYCKGGVPEKQGLVFQVIVDGDGGVIRVTNAENS
jgi:hypothetical protein